MIYNVDVGKILKALLITQRVISLSVLKKYQFFLVYRLTASSYIYNRILCFRLLVKDDWSLMSHEP
jgi:hypothetical protein